MVKVKFLIHGEDLSIDNDSHNLCIIIRAETFHTKKQMVFDFEAQELFFEKLAPRSGTCMQIRL